MCRQSAVTELIIMKYRQLEVNNRKKNKHSKLMNKNTALSLTSFATYLENEIIISLLLVSLNSNNYVI